MIEEALKLTAYFSERQRASGGFLADAMLGLYARDRLLASVALRGVEGFGAGHRLQTERLLTLSEDLPYVTVAVDTRERIEAVLPRVAGLCRPGLVTLERARMITGPFQVPDLTAAGDEAIKLTLLVGRGERVGGRPASRVAIAALHDAGVDGATAFLGLDGTVHGLRERARFFARNAGVPVLVVAVGRASAVEAALEKLRALLERPLLLLERVRVCKVAGELRARPDACGDADPSGLPVWNKLMVHVPENARHGHEALHAVLIRRLREEGAMGATALRGVWGYQAGHVPHGDGLLSPRRRVPVVVSVIDTPERTLRWFDVVDGLTAGAGLVTSEIVPAARPADGDPPRA